MPPYTVHAHVAPQALNYPTTNTNFTTNTHTAVRMRTQTSSRPFDTFRRRHRSTNRLLLLSNRALKSHLGGVWQTMQPTVGYVTAAAATRNAVGMPPRTISTWSPRRNQRHAKHKKKEKLTRCAQETCTAVLVCTTSKPTNKTLGNRQPGTRQIDGEGKQNLQQLHTFSLKALPARRWRKQHTLRFRPTDSKAGEST